MKVKVVKTNVNAYSCDLRVRLSAAVGFKVNWREYRAATAHVIAGFCHIKCKIMACCRTTRLCVVLEEADDEDLIVEGVGIEERSTSMFYRTYSQDDLISLLGEPKHYIRQHTCTNSVETKCFVVYLGEEPCNECSNYVLPHQATLRQVPVQDCKVNSTSGFGSDDDTEVDDDPDE